MDEGRGLLALQLARKEYFRSSYYHLGVQRRRRTLFNPNVCEYPQRARYESSQRPDRSEDFSKIFRSSNHFRCSQSGWSCLCTGRTLVGSCLHLLTSATDHTAVLYLAARPCREASQPCRSFHVLGHSIRRFQQG